MGIAQGRSAEQSQTSQASASSDRGAVVAIGGAEDKFKDKVILSRFVELAGGRDARVTVVPTASSIESAGERYKAIFLGLGVGSADVAFISDRAGANSRTVENLLSESTGIFLTGGNQMRLSSVLGGTRAMECILERNSQGAVVAGTSAGASILSSHMVAFGASGGSPKQRMAQMVAGFGLITNVIIDQHFRQRDRIGRLLMLVAGNPSLLGIGIDEDTAVIVEADGKIEVAGRNSVTIVDGSNMASDIYKVKGHGGISISGAVMHVLTNGHQYDSVSRSLVTTL
ncbi:MAG: cyanophycinase [Thermomicrobiales bacterium]